MLAKSVIIINVILGHCIPPTGILFTPVALTLSAAILVFCSKTLRPLYMTFIIVGLIALNDIGIKLFAGGDRDPQGLGRIHFFLFIGLVPTYILALIGIFRNEKGHIIEKLLSSLIFPALIVVHLYFFYDLGLGLSI